MKKTGILFLSAVFALSSLTGAAAEFKQIAEFNAPEANQGIGVDGKYFYAIDNQKIGKYDKNTGELVAKWGARTVRSSTLTAPRSSTERSTAPTPT